MAGKAEAMAIGRTKGWARTLGFVATAVCAGCTATPARTLPPGFVLEEVARPLDFPGAVAFTPDGRVLVAEIYTGRVRVIEGGALAPEPLLEVPDLAAGPRQGLLGLAVDPDHASNGHLYVFYTQDLGTAALEPTWRSIQDWVFEGHGCVQCHAGAAPPAGLDLTESASYAALVGVPSAEMPSVPRVAPGDPDGSYLLRKIEGAEGISGGPMPPASWPPLDAATVAAVRDWIALGAPLGEEAPPGTTVRNRVVRFTEDGLGGAADPFVVLDDIPAADEHNGGAIAFAPDGTLLVQTGENFVEALAQDPASLAGKILRVHADGTAPTDNPFTGVPGARPEVWTLGHRNGFGLAPDRIHPVPPRAYVSENGPERDDELNLASAGLNFGWPLARGAAGMPAYADPLHTWPTPVAPTGLALYDGAVYPPGYAGSLFVGRFNRLNPTVAVIERFALDSTGSFVEAAYGFLTADLGPSGFLLGLAQGPDGLVYFTTGDALYRVRYEGADGDADGCPDVSDAAPAAASPDEDADGFGADCDCDDEDAAVHPGRPEIFGNGVDDDCNGAYPSPGACPPPTTLGGARPPGAADALAWALVVLPPLLRGRARPRGGRPD